MKRILIADDVKAIRMVIKRMLSKLPEDWIIDEAADGAEALDHCFSSEPDILLLDVQIPRIDGWKVLQTIREVDQDITIIMVTASESPDDVLRAIELGATGFVGKPFDPDELADALGFETMTGRPQLQTSA